MTDKSILTILTEARALIARPENWCQGSFRVERVGGVVAYCARGAVLSSISSRPYSEEHILDVLAAALPSGWGLSALNSLMQVALFNNSHTHAEIIALFDRAIATERARTGDPDRRDAQVQTIINDAMNAAAAEKDCVVA